MASNRVYNTVERLITDCMAYKNPLIKKNRDWFGGKKVLFGGDFRQVLPVVKKGGRSAIVNSTIKKCKFWRFVIYNNIILLNLSPLTNNNYKKTYLKFY